MIRANRSIFPRRPNQAERRNDHESRGPPQAAVLAEPIRLQGILLYNLLTLIPSGQRRTNGRGTYIRYRSCVTRLKGFFGDRRLGDIHPFLIEK